ncbi:MAG: sensor domain-containing diguanylate cyclase [Candidatus Hydrogenedentota bacterium]
MFDYSTETLKFRSFLIPLSAGFIATILFFPLSNYVIRSSNPVALAHGFLLLIIWSGIFTGREFTFGLTTLAALVLAYRSMQAPWTTNLALVAEVLLFYKTAQVGSAFFAAAQDLHQSNTLSANQLDEEYNLLQEEVLRHQSRCDALEEKGARFRMLGEAASSLGSSLDETEVAARVVAETTRVVRGEVCHLFLTHEGSMRLQASNLAETLRKAAEPLANDEFNQAVIRTASVLSVSDVTRDFRFKGISGASFQSLIAAPFIVGGKVVGVLRVHGSKPDAFSTDDLRLLAIIAQVASVACDNSRLFARTREMAMHDGLTKLHARWYFNDRFESECQRALRYKTKVSLIITDIDFFKKFNDTHGHVFGDKVLARVAELVKKTVRKVDIAGRYGGEEFTVILPKCGRDGARMMAERIREIVEREAGKAMPEPVKITVSVGTSTFPDDVDKVDSLFDAADMALYAAKSRGRNRVVCAAEVGTK